MFVVAKIKAKGLRLDGYFPAAETLITSHEQASAGDNAFEIERNVSKSSSSEISTNVFVFSCRSVAEKRTLLGLSKGIMNECKKTQIIKNKASGWSVIQASEKVNDESAEETASEILFEEVGNDMKYQQLISKVPALSTEFVNNPEHIFAFDGIYSCFDVNSKSKARQRVRFVAFTNALFVIGVKDGKLEQIAYFHVGQTRFLSIADTESIKDALEFQCTAPQATPSQVGPHVMVFCKSNEEKNEFSKTVKAVINEYKKKLIKSQSLANASSGSFVLGSDKPEGNLVIIPAEESSKKMVEIMEGVEGIWEEGLVTPARVIKFEIVLTGIDNTNRETGESSSAPAASTLSTQKDSFTLFGMNDLLVLAKNQKSGSSLCSKTLVGLFPANETKFIVLGDQENAFEIERKLQAQYSSSAKKKPPVFSLFCSGESEAKATIKHCKEIINEAKKREVMERKAKDGSLSSGSSGSFALSGSPNSSFVGTSSLSPSPSSSSPVAAHPPPPSYSPSHPPASPASSAPSVQPAQPATASPGQAQGARWAAYRPRTDAAAMNGANWGY